MSERCHPRIARLAVQAALVVLAQVFALAAWGQAPANADRGRLLYENHCIVCHTSKVHRRMPPLPLDFRELREIVQVWAREERLNWSEQDIVDVAEYLDRTYYRMLRR